MNDIASDPHAADLQGEHYIQTLQRLHEMLRPKTYLEIGTLQGQSLALARCPAIAIDPAFQIIPEYLPGIFAKPSVHFFQTGSDDFFAANDPTGIFGAPIDMAFLDGMHRCEYLLRDFINTERHCKRNSIVALHDCVPVESAITSRFDRPKATLVPHRAGWWLGDVWRTCLLLKRFRPDLSVTVLDCVPTGLVLVTNLDPESQVLMEGYDGFVRQMLDWDLDKIGVHALLAEFQVEAASLAQMHEDLTQRFWL